MTASPEINVHIEELIKICHGVALLIFGVAIVFAGLTVSRLRSPSDTYKSRQFTFGYFSLAAWILWFFQYAILSAPFLSFPTGPSLATVMWLGVAQNALWICAALSLNFKSLSQKSWTIPVFVIYSAVVVWIAYTTDVLSSAELAGSIALFDGFLNVPFFVILAITITQLRFNKNYAELFLIHGYTQWTWRWMWLSPWATNPLVQLGFPLWRAVLFIAWSKLILAMAERTEPAEKKLAPPSKPAPDVDVQLPKKPNLLARLNVMISSTVEDLIPEREAADRAIRSLKLSRFRAETLGSFPHSPEEICALMAEQCDIFVLIIGERYGYTIRSREMSVVEFEYEVALRQNRGKILVYIKEGVTRDAELERFVKRVEDFEKGHFRTLFKTADELPEMIQGDIARWIHANGPQSFDGPSNSH